MFVFTECLLKELKLQTLLFIEIEVSYIRFANSQLVHPWIPSDHALKVLVSHMFQNTFSADCFTYYLLPHRTFSTIPYLVL